MVSSGFIRHPPKSNALCSLLKYFHQFPQIRPFHGHYRSSFSSVAKTTVRQHHEEVEHKLALYRWDMCQKRPPATIHIYIYNIYIYMLPLRWYIFSLPLKHLHEVVPPQKTLPTMGLSWGGSVRPHEDCWHVAGGAVGWQFSGEEHLWCVMKLGLLCFLEVGDSNMDGDGPAYLYSAFRPQYSALFWENPTSKFCPHLPVRWHQELLQSLLLTVSMKNAIFSMKTTTISI